MENEKKEEKKLEKWIFSIINGRIFSVTPDEFRLLDPFNVPLKTEPQSSNCKKCHGRLYTGFDTIEKVYTICKPCMKKYADLQFMLALNAK